MQQPTGPLSGFLKAIVEARNIIFSALRVLGEFLASTIRRLKGEYGDVVARYGRYYPRRSLMSHAGRPPRGEHRPIPRPLKGKRKQKWLRKQQRRK